MSEAELKSVLFDKIEHASTEQLKDIYGLVTDYFNNKYDAGEWDTLPENLQKKIMQGLQEADNGEGIPAKEAIKRIREKHGLNG